MSIIKSPSIVNFVTQQNKDQARDYAFSSRAKNTKRAYKVDWQEFCAWCTQNQLESLPASPLTVGLYLSAKATTLKVSTLNRKLTAIRQAHYAAQQPFDSKHPAIREIWNGIKRTYGVEQQGKQPLLTDDLKKIIQSMGTSLQDLRNKALLLIGFSGAFRRSELIGLNVEDITYQPEGLTILLRRSKTDQEQKGYLKGIPFGHHTETCAVRALKQWLDVSKICSGPIFRKMQGKNLVSSLRLSDKAVSRIIKKSIVSIGISPKKYAGHSLRAGFATAAASAGVEERIIMAQTGHKRVDTLRKYIRIGNLFKQNAAGMIGL